LSIHKAKMLWRRRDAASITRTLLQSTLCQSTC
jgi:hypothetical protein